MAELVREIVEEDLPRVKALLVLTNRGVLIPILKGSAV